MDSVGCKPFSQNPQVGQNFLVFEPKVAQASETTPLTPALWQSQMQKMVNLCQTGPVAPASVHPSSDIQPVAGRSGKVLRPENFLKADQYPGLHSKKLQDGRLKHPQPLIEGAPNYRELGEGIHGTAQPTIDGMRNVLKQAGAAPGGNKKAVWTNLREEPVVYLNGQPVNLRHLKTPYNNQESPGRSAKEVDKIEKQLKADVLAEAERNGGYFVMHDEDAGPPPKVVEKRVKLESVQTVSEVYDQLKHEGYNVEYKRLPVTDMQKPEDRDIDELVKHLKSTDPEDALIFNCHAGQGRTTTAMVLASIVRRSQSGDDTRLLKDEAFRHDIKETGDHKTRNYKEILKTIQDSQKMLNSQEDADAVIERYGDVHNLKESVGKARKDVERKETPEARAEAQKHVNDYLERYHTIVAFDQYAKENGPKFKTSFSEWKHQHPEIDQNLERLQVALQQRLQNDGTAFA